MLDEKLFTVLATAAALLVNSFVVSGLANMAWAFATVNHSVEKLFTALAREEAQQVSEFKRRASR